MLTHPEKLGGRLHEGLIATARIILLGLVMDVIYQLMVFGNLHPGEAAIIAILLAFVPYLLLRGPFARIAGWWRRRSSREPAPGEATTCRCCDDLKRRLAFDRKNLGPDLDRRASSRASPRSPTAWPRLCSRASVP